MTVQRETSHMQSWPGALERQRVMVDDRLVAQQRRLIEEATRWVLHRYAVALRRLSHD